MGAQLTIYRIVNDLCTVNLGCRDYLQFVNSMCNRIKYDYASHTRLRFAASFKNQCASMIH